MTIELRDIVATIAILSRPRSIHPETLSQIAALARTPSDAEVAAKSITLEALVDKDDPDEWARAWVLLAVANASGSLVACGLIGKAIKQPIAVVAHALRDILAGDFDGPAGLGIYVTPNGSLLMIRAAGSSVFCAARPDDVLAAWKRLGALVFVESVIP